MSVTGALGCERRGWEWGVLRKARCVGEFLKKGGNVRQHRNVDVLVDIVPTEVETAELCTGPVDGCFIVQV